MSEFADLVSSRKNWIESVLKPWCQSARRADLIKAEDEWHDIAGQVSAEITLWTWAWSRFPELICENMPGVNETAEVVVQFLKGGSVTGVPDNRKSARGQLVLLCRNELGKSEESQPISIDDIDSVKKC